MGRIGCLAVDRFESAGACLRLHDRAGLQRTHRKTIRIAAVLLHVITSYFWSNVHFLCFASYEVVTGVVGIIPRYLFIVSFLSIFEGKIKK
ncbi:hypothetical protein BX600DRAFT_175784 [Xylariales sp. PMI_506]|nr:hypothetical protein BX600DRAFT_175784 [Xylariales sp. PMI_506]